MLLKRLLLALWPLVVPLLASPAVAAGRQGEPVVVCVLAPRVEPLDEGEAVGVVPLGRPALVVLEPLQQVRIEADGGRLLWSRRARLGTPLPTPLSWPLPPLQPDQQVLLRLQPQGAADDAFAHVHLRAADTARMAAATALINGLGGRPEDWIVAINGALRSGDVPLAWALLYAPQAPAAEPLEALRREIWRRGCGS